MTWKIVWQYDFCPLIFLILFSLFLFFFPFNNNRPLWEPDEGMHAQVSKEILETGDWITPRFNGEKFFDKPILHYWLVSLSFLFLGVNELAARLPAAILGLGGVLVVFYLGKYLYNRETGFLAGIILATTGIYLALSQSVVHDIGLSFFISLSLLCFYLFYLKEERSNTCLLLLYLSMGFGVLAKGPIGFLLPMGIIILFLLLVGKIGQLKELVTRQGILIFFAISLPWYILVTLKNPEFFSHFFFKQNLGRFFSPPLGDSQPSYYYIPLVAISFIPWTYYLPNALIAQVTTIIKSRDKERRASLFIILWLGVIFLFFSLAKAKQWPYLLPLYPALALMLGRFWYNYLFMAVPAGNNLNKGIRLSSWLLLISYLPAPLFLLIYLHYHPLPYIPQPLLIQTIIISLLALISTGASHIFFLIKDKKKGLFLINLIFILVTTLIFIYYGFPIVSQSKSVKRVAIKLGQLVPAGEKIVFYKHLRESAIFYSGRQGRVIESKEELRQYLASKEQVYCLINKKDYEKVRDYIADFGFIVDQEGKAILISNRKSLQLPGFAARDDHYS